MEKKLAIIISMYDERDTVKKTIKTFENENEVIFIVVQSDDGLPSNQHIEYIKQKSHYIKLPNLSKGYSRNELPAQAICRNIKKGFEILYNIDAKVNNVVFILGDTYIKKPSFFKNKCSELNNKGLYGYVCQAVGQHFNAPTDNPDMNKAGNRYQSDATTDVSAVLMILNASICYKYHLFKDIEVINQWTSEHCLGYELCKSLEDKNFHSVFKRLNNPKTYVYGIDDNAVICHYPHRIPAHR